MRVFRVFAIVSLAILATALFAAATSRSATAQVAPALSHQPPAFLIGHSSSLNWAGYWSYAGDGTFTDVKGSWTQPTATCSRKTTYSSFWVGLDGYNSSTVEQVGTEADCSGGKPSYYAWWEIYPSPSNSIRGFTVTHGVTYTAEVKYLGGGSFALSLSGGGHSFSTTQTLANPALSSAEWIAEAPSMCAGSCRVLPLTNFGKAHFSGSSANGAAINNSAWQFDPLTMVTNGGTVKASTGPLTASGTAFDVTWAHS